MAWHWLEPQMISIVSTFLCIISDRSLRHAGDQWSCSDHSNSVARDACDIQLLGRHGLRTSVPLQHFWSMFLTSSNFKTSARMCQGMLCALQILVQWFWPYTIMNLSFQDSESSCDSRCSNRPWTQGSYHTRHRHVIFAAVFGHSIASMLFFAVSRQSMLFSGTLTDIGSILGRVAMMYLRKGPGNSVWESESWEFVSKLVT